jgi:hypothetical protein
MSNQGHETTILDTVAGLLDAAGRASVTRRPGDTTRGIRSALKLLSTLGDDLLDDEDIQAAVQAAMRALRSVG